MLHKWSSQVQHQTVIPINALIKSLCNYKSFHKMQQWHIYIQSIDSKKLHQRTTTNAFSLNSCGILGWLWACFNRSWRSQSRPHREDSLKCKSGSPIVVTVALFGVDGGIIERYGRWQCGMKEVHMGGIKVMSLINLSDRKKYARIQGERSLYGLPNVKIKPKFIRTQRRNSTRPTATEATASDLSTTFAQH